MIFHSKKIEHIYIESGMHIIFAWYHRASTCFINKFFPAVLMDVIAEKPKRQSLDLRLTGYYPEISPILEINDRVISVDYHKRQV